MILEIIKNAKNIFYNNSKSGRKETNVQDAIDGLNSELGKMLPLKGGKMSGGIEMNGNTIGSVGDIFLNDKNAFLNALLTNMNIEIKKKRDSFSWLNPVPDLNDFYNGVALFNENASNRPTQDWYMVLSAGDANTRTQVAVSLYSGVIYTRYCSASNWGGWSDKFALKSDLEKTNTTVAQKVINNSYATNAIGFQWTTSGLEACVDATNLGAIALKSDLSDFVTTITTKVETTAVPGSIAKIPLTQPILNGYKVVTNKVQQIYNQSNIEMYEVNNSWLFMTFTDAPSQTVGFVVEWLMIKTK